MSRFKVPDKETWTPEQSAIEPHAIDQRFREFSQLEYKDRNGTLLGPFPSLFYTPNLVEPVFALLDAVIINPIFTFKERELAILAMLAVNDAAYPLYAHSQIALAAAGLSRTQIEQAVNGECPSDLTPTEEMVYQLALELATLRSRLTDQSFQRAEAVLGQARIAALTHLVAVYLYAALLCNVGDGIVPEPRDDVFLARKKAKFNLR